jgi:hypothetical protein
MRILEVQASLLLSLSLAGRVGEVGNRRIRARKIGVGFGSSRGGMWRGKMGILKKA